VRVLVTGGAGYVGSHTAKALALASHEPVVLDDLRTGYRENVRWGPFVEGDVADRDLVRRTMRDHRVEAVVHFAASAYVGESMRDPRGYYRNNLGATLALLDAMLEEDVSTIVFSSTCATYGVPTRLPITEAEPQRPVNPYGATKLAVEGALRWYGEAYGLRWMALRYFNAAGADPDGALGERHQPETHLLPLAILAALGAAPPLVVFGTDYATPDGTAVRDYTHVADLADAHLRALSHLAEGGPPGALNLGTGRGQSVRAVLEAVESVGRRPVPTVRGAPRVGDPPALVADPTAAERTLGWRARFTDLDEIVRTAWAWHAHPSRMRDTSRP
jgi:UDP-arabinose 4-epimerase